MDSQQSKINSPFLLGYFNYMININDFLKNLILFVLIYAFALLINFPYLLNSAFFTDDLYLIEQINYFGPYDTFLSYLQVNPRRPLQWIYYIIVFSLFKSSSVYAILIGLAITSLGLLVLYKILFILKANKFLGFLSISIILLSPVADSTRLWASGSIVNLAICFFLIGYFFLLKANLSIKYVVYSSIFFILSGLFYEAVCTFILLNLFIEFLKYIKGWKSLRYLIPSLISLVLLIPFYWSSNNPNVPGYKPRSFDDMLSSSLVWIIESIYILGGTAGYTSLIAGLVIIILSVLILIYSFKINDNITIKLISVSLALFAFGYLPFLLGPSYFHPLVPGWNNRINGLSLIGSGVLIATIIFFILRKLMLVINQILPNYLSIASIGLILICFLSNLIYFNFQYQKNG
jgi:hypothetical protein